jgi:hypothetical protein
MATRELGVVVMRSRLPIRLVGAVCLLGILTIAAPTRANAGQTPSCRAGKTVFHHGAIRAFVITSNFGRSTQEGSKVKTFYVCSATLRRPHVFDRSAPFTFEDLYDYRLFGERLGFIWSSSGVQSGSGEGVGWVNLRTGRAKQGAINESEGLSEEDEEEPGLPRIPIDDVNYAIATDGTVAVLGEQLEPNEWEVAELAVKPRALAAPRRLLRVKAPAEGLAVASLAITATSVTWTTRSGLPGTAPR